MVYTFVFYYIDVTITMCMYMTGSLFYIVYIKHTFSSLKETYYTACHSRAA